MDPGYLSAISGLAGAIIGGLTSFSSSWIIQREQRRAADRQAQRAKREALYHDFITEAVALFTDSLTRQVEDPARLVNLLALLSRMRLVASRRVVNASVRLEEFIIATYNGPNFETVHDMVTYSRDSGWADIIADWGEACREDLGTQAG